MTTGARTTLIAAGAAGMLAVVLASCGSSGTKPNTVAPSATAPPVTTTAPHGGVMGGTNCAVPALPGQRVTVVLSDMGGGMMGSRGAGVWMMLHAVPQTVSSGMVSLVAVNHGTRTHELVVLPLASGAALGARPVGADNTVAESGSLGEASADCRAGGGDGIAAGGAGWVSLPLQPGRYELICNLPGHYAAGMHTELDVT